MFNFVKSIIPAFLSASRPLLCFKPRKLSHEIQLPFSLYIYLCLSLSLSVSIHMRPRWCQFWLCRQAGNARLLAKFLRCSDKGRSKRGNAAEEVLCGRQPNSQYHTPHPWSLQKRSRIITVILLIPIYNILQAYYPF